MSLFSRKNISFNNKNVKTYLFFLVFTAFLWFALQFSKNYSREIEFNIKYTKVDNQKIVQSESDQNVILMLEGSGFQLLKFYIFNRSLKLDVRRATSKSEIQSYFTGKKMLDVIKSSLNYSGAIAYSSRDTINVYFDKIVSKLIPVEIKSKISYAPGFSSQKGVSALQEAVEVKGPKFILDTLKSISTQELKLVDVKENYQGKLGLDLKKLPKELKIDKKKLEVIVEVDKLTEEEFTIPVTIKNIPSGVRVQLFPKQVSVIFGVALKDFSTLKVSDFKVVVDMKKTTSGSNTLALELIKKPDLIYNVRLSEKEVQYIVIK